MTLKNIIRLPWYSKERAGLILKPTDEQIVNEVRNWMKLLRDRVDRRPRGQTQL
jgi:hypothetical protein